MNNEYEFLIRLLEDIIRKQRTTIRNLSVSWGIMFIAWLTLLVVFLFR